MSSAQYVGNELEIFAYARNWKHYWSSIILPFMKGDVLEVGAGIGSNTKLLLTPAVRSWMCLEPDRELARQASQALYGQTRHSVRVGSIEALEETNLFDAILYIDVLEHIEQDAQELSRAAKLLKAAGKLIVLSPAHQWLYTAFDRSIGHFRRYSRTTLRACTPRECTLERMGYLDSVGLLASATNRLFLHQAMPTVNQIVFWDRYMIPPSRFLDRVLFGGIGKSILAVWSRN